MATAFPIGSIIHYQNDFWVVLASKWNDATLRIIRPHVGNEKREINSYKAKDTSFRCKLVSHNGKDVLVTPKGMLISMVSERLLKNTTADAKAALRKAGL